MTLTGQLHAVGLIAIAMLLGAAIGLQRARHGHPAGLRTNMLVAGASALIVVLGSAALGSYTKSGGDPTRALHAVVTGIGFLGGGMILRDQTAGRATGLTSAASVFIVSALGAAVGLGQVVLAVGATILCLLTLGGVKGLQRRLPHIVGGERDEPDDTDDTDDTTGPRDRARQTS